MFTSYLGHVPVGAAGLTSVRCTSITICNFTLSAGNRDCRLVRVRGGGGGSGQWSG